MQRRKKTSQLSVHGFGAAAEARVKTSLHLSVLPNTTVKKRTALKLNVVKDCNQAVNFEKYKRLSSCSTNRDPMFEYRTSLGMLSDRSEKRHVSLGNKHSIIYAMLHG